jgi:hypothetical protein
MSLAQSATTLFGNAASPKPTADAWCVFELNSGVDPTIVDSVGVSSVKYIQTGVFRVNFSDPAKFSSGAYVAMVQPEFGNNSSAYFTCVAQGTTASNTATASGASASADIAVLQFQPTDTANPSKLQDYNSSTRARVNAAFVCLRSDSDLRKPHLANLLYRSDRFDITTAPAWNSTVINSPGSYGAVDPSVTSSPVAGVSAFYFDGNAAAANYVAQAAGSVNTTHTFSVYFKSGTGVTAQLQCGGVNNNFGYDYNLSTGTLTGVGTVPPSGGSRSGSMVDAGGGWKRCILTFSTPNAPAPLINQVYSDTRIYMAAAQLEYGSVASDYIRTTDTRPVYGDQTKLINLYPSTRGFGASGATYSSSLAQITNKRAASAWGTLVIPPNKGGTVQAYLEGAYNIQGVSAGGNCVFDLYFTKTMGNTGYCVVTSTEQENIFPEINAVGLAQTIPPTYEYTLNLMRNRSAVNDQRTTTGFSITSLRQAETGAAASRQFTATGATYAYSIGYTQKIHFMVFGGGSSYGTS